MKQQYQLNNQVILSITNLRILLNVAAFLMLKNYYYLFYPRVDLSVIENPLLKLIYLLYFEVMF